MPNYRDSIVDNIPLVKKIVFAKCGGLQKEDQEDIVQSILLRLLDKEHLYVPSRGKIEAFIAVVAYNYIKNYYRDTARQPTADLQEDQIDYWHVNDLTPLAIALIEEQATQQ